MCTTEQNPLENHVVVNILKDYVSCPQTILSCKLVNNTWNNVFKLKASQVLPIKNLTNVFRPYPTGMGYNYITHKFHTNVPDIANLYIHKKINELSNPNVVNFFKNKGRFLKHLALRISNFEQSTQGHFNFIENVLLKWCPGLQELNLIGPCAQQTAMQLNNNETKEVVLKKLVMDYSENDFFIASIHNTNILQVMKKLETFVYIGNVLAETQYNVSVTLMTKISLSSKYLSTLEFYNVTIGKSAFNVISKAGWLLTKFIFKGSIEECLEISHLNSFISAYKDSIKHLHLQLNWISKFDKNELNIHDLTKLNVLEINVYSINVGASGLLGNLKCLNRMELYGTIGRWSCQHKLNDMFRNGSCSTLKFLSLDKSYIQQVIFIQELFPNLKELQINCSSDQLYQLDHCFNILFQKKFVLDMLLINVHYSETDACNERLNRDLFFRFFQYQVRILRIAAIQSVNIFPWLFAHWIHEGLSNHNHTFFSIELEGFKIHDSDIAHIAKIATERSNFLKLVECIIISKNKGGCHFLKEEQLYSYNLDAKINDIMKNVRENNINFY